MNWLVSAENVDSEPSTEICSYTYNPWTYWHWNASFIHRQMQVQIMHDLCPSYLPLLFGAFLDFTARGCFLSHCISERIRDSSGKSNHKLQIKRILGWIPWQTKIICSSRWRSALRPRNLSLLSAALFYVVSAAASSGPLCQSWYWSTPRLTAAAAAALLASSGLFPSC